jgi:hypothetical protein
MQPNQSPDADVPLADPAVAMRRGDRALSSGPQLVVLGWCLWLLGSWAVTLLHDAAVSGARWMVFSAMTGLLAIWPAFRLSQGRRENADPWRPAVETALGDWLVLMLVLQAVIWPLRVAAQWSVMQTAAIDAVLASWSLLTGLILAVGSLSARGSARTIAMAGCLILLLGEPAWMALAGRFQPPLPAWSTWGGPISALATLTESSMRIKLELWATPVLAVTGAAVGGWLVLLVVARLRPGR